MKRRAYIMIAPELIHDILLLPEDVRVHENGIHYDMTRGSLLVSVTGDRFPEVNTGDVATLVLPTYHKSEDGRVNFVEFRDAYTGKVL